jgi:D-alanine-D-alanine ligase
VLSGGPSLEAQASRVSAAGVYTALAESGHRAVWLDLSGEGEWEWRSDSEAEEGASALPQAGDRGTGSSLDALASLLRATSVDVAFPVIPGQLGEDGQIGALCESLSIACVGCSAPASAACYDKVLFKSLVRAAGLPLARFLAVGRDAWERDPAWFGARVDREIRYPCIVKPSQSGSSFGLSRVAGSDDLAAAIAAAHEFDDVALVEELFVGSDVEIGVFENGSLLVGNPVELEYEGLLYDFDAKYLRGDRRYLPARCSPGLVERLRQGARAAFLATSCNGMARVDLLADLTGERFVVNEINTIPYMPESSTFAKSLCHRSGKTYPELVTAIAHAAASRGQA